VSLIKLDNDKYTGLYKQIANVDMLRLAYHKIKSKPGNMTPGIDEETLYGINNKYLEKLSESLLNESFQFRPTRRVYIPKTNGKTRPLGIASPRDKIVHEAMRIVLDGIFDPIFLESSHGFRSNRGQHTALKEISKWNGIS